MTTLIPADTQRAAKRGFIRTTAQGYAATLSGGVTVTAILAIATGEVDLLTAGVTLGVALVSPLLAGLASYLSITSKGIPEDYESEVAAEAIEQATRRSTYIPRN